MQSITIRNIPDEIMDIVRALSKKEKRSINSELLLLLENVLTHIVSKGENEVSRISAETQIALWNDISGKWKDKRKTKEIINDIYESRTLGREISL